MSIASRIESISEHLSNAYNSLENIGVDLTSIDKNISNLSSQIESVYPILPKVTNTGINDVLLNNTKKGKIEMTLGGNLSQITTTGKNLAQVTGMYCGTSGMATLQNGIIKVTNGKYTSATAITAYLNKANNWNDEGLQIENEKTYSISVICDGKVGTSSYRTIWVNINGTSTSIGLFDTNKTITYTFTADRDYKMKFISFDISPNTTFDDDYTIRYQIEEAASPTSYEPYSGGAASPSAGFPQSINAVTGNNTINICGKNLFNSDVITSQTAQGIEFSVSNQIIHIEGTATRDYIATSRMSLPKILKAGKTYHFKASGSLTKKIWLYSVHAGGNIISNVANDDSFTPSVDCKFFSLVIEGLTVNNSYNEDYTIQIEENSSSTDYEPYISQSYPINLGSLKLYKFGTYQDYIYENNGHWYKKGNIRYITKNITDMNNSDSYPGWTGVEYINTDYPGYGAIYELVGSNWKSNITTSNWMIYKNGSTLYFSSSLTQTQWKSQYPNLIFELCYRLSTPYDEEITDTTLIEQLNTLKNNCKSYNGQTTIFQIDNNNNDLPFIISASALSQSNS